MASRSHDLLYNFWLDAIGERIVLEPFIIEVKLRLEFFVDVSFDSLLCIALHGGVQGGVDF